MSAARKLVELAMTMAPTMSPAPLSAPRPTFRPTLRPSARPTLLPACLPRFTELPSTQRCATVHPRFDMARGLEAKSLLQVLRSNVGFLESLLGGDLAPCARGALSDVRATIDRLEQRVGSPIP
jgi:hypothetical protein